jgi:hypothetical protein
MKPELILLCLGLVTFVVFIFTNAYPTCEGFTNPGNVPNAPQTSNIPRDTSAATTNDPKVSLPQPIDVEALLEVIKNFQLLYNAQNPNTLNIDQASLQQVEYFMKQSDNLVNQLQAALADSNSAQMSLEDVTDIRRAYECTIDILRNKSGSDVATDPNTITLPILQALNARVQGESLRLANLRSSSANILARINDLNNLSSNLSDMMSSVQRKQLNLSDIPIKAEDAQRFLSALDGENLNVPLPNLPGMKPASDSGPKPVATSATASLFQSAPVQSLLEMARSMKWSVAVAFENDPTIQQNQQILNKLNKMDSSLNDHMISNTPMSQQMYQNYTNQLKTLQGMVNTNNTDVPTFVRGLPTPMVQPVGVASQADIPSQTQLAQAQNISGLSADDTQGEDTMNMGKMDYMIKHRGSYASFDTDKVGGLDYKSRVQDICQQIQASGLGNAENFGCIKDPKTVSASYSWKGNYQMVCSRLADTWGAWYPQMYGCPDVDPTKKFMKPPSEVN